MKHLWVIEIYGEFGWSPTVGVGKTANEARKLLDDWLKINTFDSFRIKKYIRKWESKNDISIRKGIPQGRLPLAVSH